MTEKSKRILILLTGSVILVFLLAFAAIGGYLLGQESSTIDERKVDVIVEEIQNDIQAERPPAAAVESSDDQANISSNNTTGDNSAPSDSSSTGDNSSTGDSSSPVDSSPTDDSSPVDDSKADENGSAESNGQSNLDTGSASNEQSLDQNESQERIPIDPEDIDEDLLIEVWEIINREFDGALPTSEEITYESIRGSMDLLDDQYSRFLSPEAAERSRIQIQGGYEGIGAYVDLTDNGDMLIVRPIDGQPADEAGILAGDIVTEVDGETIKGMALAEIVSLVTGPQGTDVTLTVYRPDTDEVLVFTITRQRIEFPLVTSRMLDENIGYVRLTSFSSGADEQLIPVMEELLENEPIGLIFDLRDNPGGLLVESLEVSDLFLADGVVAYQRDSQGNEKVFESNDGDLAEEIPLVVLVNAGSASGSEIVAGAIQDLGRGVLIGENTLGKGSVQQSYTLSDGSELRVTVARWYTPNDITIGADGIAPDIEVETPEDLGDEDDTQLNKAIEYLLELASERS